MNAMGNLAEITDRRVHLNVPAQKSDNYPAPEVIGASHDEDCSTLIEGIAR